MFQTSGLTGSLMRWSAGDEAMLQVPSKVRSSSSRRASTARATCILALASLAAFAGSALAADTPAGPAVRTDASTEAKRLSRNLDELYRAKSSRSRMAMTVTTPHYERKIEMSTLSRGMDDTLVRILSPRKERGVATLKRGNEMWNFLPKVQKTIRVPPSMMMGSWMGSDLTNDDLVRASSWERDYTVVWDAERPGARCLRYVPRAEAAVTWQRVVACFSLPGDMPTTVEYYDEKGRLARSMNYRDVRDFGGRKLPATMEIVPHLAERKGNRTVMTVLEMQWDVPVSDADFSQAALRRAP
jgi:outer membrane lipoprotein-sorting protein